MNYVGNIIRPPSEHASLILQVTTGCSHNQCTFCGVYKEKKFTIKPLEIIKADLEEVQKYKIIYKRVFLADGDALIIPTDQLVKIIATVKSMLPTIRRVGVYANTKSILKKTLAELSELKRAGLGILYQGVESGNAEVLSRINKGATPQAIIEAVEKVKAAKMKLSQTYLLGVGGKEYSLAHAQDTGKLISQSVPNYVSLLTLMLLPNTPLFHSEIAGDFTLPSKLDLIKELKSIIENIQTDQNFIFTSNHASNYLPIFARFPVQQAEVLSQVTHLIKNFDEALLKPESMRAL
ncbi:MAG: radical SAM protein [Spirochaetes bacterium]|nr:radical SAM protein [Spirochaetota bacterium]